MENQSKFARHLKTHEKKNVEVAQVLALPKDSKERKKMLNKLRNKGNHQHNTDVLTSGTGLLKVSREPKKKYDQKIMCTACIARLCTFGRICGDMFENVLQNQW